MNFFVQIHNKNYLNVPAFYAQSIAQSQQAHLCHLWLSLKIQTTVSIFCSSRLYRITVRGHVTTFVYNYTVIKCQFYNSL